MYSFTFDAIEHKKNWTKDMRCESTSVIYFSTKGRDYNRLDGYFDQVTNYFKSFPIS